MNRKITYMYFSFVTAVSIAFRLFLLLFAIDSNSGFIKPEHKGSSIFMLILIALAVGFVFIFAFRSKVSTFKPTKNISFLNKVISFLFAISIFFEVMFSPLSKMLPPSQKNLDLIFGTAAFLVLICSAFKKELKLNFNPLLNVVPLVFFMIRLIGIFSIFSAFSMIVDIVFELVALCALLIGFLLFAKCENLVWSKKNSKLYFPAFLLSSSLGLTASVPKILLNLTDNTQYLHINSVPMYSVFFASAFLLLYSIENFRFEKNDK